MIRPILNKYNACLKFSKILPLLNEHSTNNNYISRFGIPRVKWQLISIKKLMPYTLSNAIIRNKDIAGKYKEITQYACM